MVTTGVIVFPSPPLCSGRTDKEREKKRASEEARLKHSLCPNYRVAASNISSTCSQFTRLSRKALM